MRRSIDGERWEGATGNEPLVVQLAAGSHRIEVRKAGYRSYTAQVDVRRGETSRSMSACREEEADDQAWAIVVLVALVPMAAQAQTSQGPLVLERIHSPFVVAPDYKIADVDGNTGQLAGAYAGRLLDDTLFGGGGYYWLVNGDRGEEMRYGGLMLGWSMPAGRMGRFGARGLVGFGTATLGRTWRRAVDRRASTSASARRSGQNARFLARDDFFVLEPQMNATVRLIRHVGVEIGGGYRSVVRPTRSTIGSIERQSGPAVFSFYVSACLGLG